MLTVSTVARDKIFHTLRSIFFHNVICYPGSAEKKGYLLPVFENPWPAQRGCSTVVRKGVRMSVILLAVSTDAVKIGTAYLS